MKINIKKLVSMTEINRKSLRVAKKVNEKGTVVILKKNIQHDVISNYNKTQRDDTITEQMIEVIAKKILSKHVKAFEELAK